MIGVLALQGDFMEHSSCLVRSFSPVKAIKKPSDLEGIDGLVLPGGESTALSRLIRWGGLEEPVREMIRKGLPVWGTCAGAILICRGGIWKCIEAVVERNAYGPQAFSCIRNTLVPGREKPIPMVFIRAPRIKNHGPDAVILSRVDDDVVALRENNALVTTFHPELTDDLFFLSLFLELVKNAKGGVRAAADMEDSSTPLIYAGS